MPQTMLFEGVSREFPACDSVSLLDHIEGSCLFAELDLGLSIHVNDTIERRTVHEQFIIPPKATVSLILDGDLDAAIDDHPLCMSSRNGPSGYLWINRQPARLDRWTCAGQRIRKVNISLPFEQCLGLASPAEAYLMEEMGDTRKILRLLRWKPNAQTLRLAEDIFASVLEASAISKLNGGIAALGLLRHALMHSDAVSAEVLPNAVKLRDAKRARKARKFMLDHIHGPLTLDSVAQQTNMSPSTLQRAFKNAYGLTVMEFVRTRRLEIARLELLEEEITVGEAAHLAGYSNAANFSTAFQREFGYPPSTCIGYLHD